MLERSFNRFLAHSIATDSSFTFRDSAGGLAGRAFEVRSGEVVIRALAARAVAGSFGAPQLLRDTARVVIPLQECRPMRSSTSPEPARGGICPSLSSRSPR